MKNKFKSYSFWTSLVGAITIFLNALGKVIGFIPDDKLISDIILGVAGILVVLGVVSAPTESEKQENELQEKEEEKDKKQTNDDIDNE